MCGFVGFLGANMKLDYRSTLYKMNQAIINRGPDNDGYWYDVDRKYPFISSLWHFHGRVFASPDFGKFTFDYE